MKRKKKLVGEENATNETRDASIGTHLSNIGESGFFGSSSYSSSLRAVSPLSSCHTHGICESAARVCECSPLTVTNTVDVTKKQQANQTSPPRMGGSKKSQRKCLRKQVSLAK